MPNLQKKKKKTMARQERERKRKSEEALELEPGTDDITDVGLVRQGIY